MMGIGRRAILKGLAGLPIATGLFRGHPAWAAQPAPVDPRERHLRNLRQLTFGGQNAEAYFSPDGRRLVFQSTRDGRGCDQIYTMDLEGNDVTMVSTGRGVTTCSFFFPDGRRFIYSSTHLSGSECPSRPDMSRGYAWGLHPTYHLFAADPDKGTLTQLTREGQYNAEGALSPDGKKIVFTSHREGDLDLYLMDSDGSNQRRLTDEYGYDGGAFFSWDGQYIVYRSFHPKTGAERREYAENLARHVFRPTWLELFVMHADGTRRRQVTDLRAASFAPCMHPGDRQIIFASNLHDPAHRSFALFVVNLDGTGLERVTYEGGFSSFPMFSPDGRQLVFVSTRGSLRERDASAPREFNVFLAEWVP
jgi:Tol biopolymer transport system component